jgi:CelD/BcsL family acetyltransferase involved in cellulose biosynthesis
LKEIERHTNNHLDLVSVSKDSLCTVVVVRDIGALAACADAWDRLAIGAVQRLPMLSHAWVTSYLEHSLRPGESWCCALAYEAGSLVGVLPLVIAPHPLLGQLFPLLRTPHDGHTPCGDAVLSASDPERILFLLLEAVKNAIPSYAVIEIKGIREGSLTLTALQQGLPGYATHIQATFLGDFIEVTGTWMDYLGNLGKNLRSNLRSARRQFERQGRIELRVLTGADARQDFLADFLALEDSGWKGQQGTSILKASEKVRFYEKLVSRLASRGWLEWHMLLVDDRLVAAEFGVRFGQSLIIPKIAYDEAFANNSPGALLTEEGVRQAFNDGLLREINHISNAEWHRKWRMRRSQYFTALMAPRHAVPASIRILPLLAPILLRQQLRSWVPEAWKRRLLAFRVWGRTNKKKISRSNVLRPWTKTKK